MGKCFIIFATVTLIWASPSSQSQSTKRATSQFEPIMSAEMIDNEATDLGFRTVGASETIIDVMNFKTPRGVKLTVQNCEFASADEAKRFFEWMLTKAIRVVKQGTELDRSGKFVGSKAIVKVRGDSNNFSVMWTRQGQFHAVFCKELSDAVSLAKEYGY